MHAKFLSPLIAAFALAPAGAALAADQATPVPEPAAVAAPAEDPGVRLSATLTGANEVGGGDADGTGSFTARIEKDRLCYTLTTSNIDEPTMAHIHKGAAGINGPVYIGLTDIDPGEHCEDIGERLDALKSKPGDYYVNVHNGDFPAGAIRGQLVRD